jgi:hypothetical protein
MLRVPPATIPTPLLLGVVLVHLAQSLGRGRNYNPINVGAFSLARVLGVCWQLIILVPDGVYAQAPDAGRLRGAKCLPTVPPTLAHICLHFARVAHPLALVSSILNHLPPLMLP